MKTLSGYIFPILGAAVPLANAAFGWHLTTTDVLSSVGALVALGGLVAHVEASGNGAAILQQVQTALTDIARVMGEVKGSTTATTPAPPAAGK